MTSTEDYQITERWRGVEQPLEGSSKILDIWNAWGTVQAEVSFILLGSIKYPIQVRFNKKIIA